MASGTDQERTACAKLPNVATSKVPRVGDRHVSPLHPGFVDVTERLGPVVSRLLQPDRWRQSLLLLGLQRPHECAELGHLRGDSSTSSRVIRRFAERVMANPVSLWSVILALP